MATNNNNNNNNSNKVANVFEDYIPMSIKRENMDVIIRTTNL